MSQPTKKDFDILKLAEEQKVSFQFMKNIIKELEDFNHREGTYLGKKKIIFNEDDVPF